MTPPPALPALDLRTLGQRIKRARERLDLSRPALAAELGVARSTVYDIEEGKHGMSAHTLRLLCCALDLSADELLGVRKIERR